MKKNIFIAIGLFSYAGFAEDPLSKDQILETVENLTLQIENASFSDNEIDEIKAKLEKTMYVLKNKYTENILPTPVDLVTPVRLGDDREYETLFTYENGNKFLVSPTKPKEGENTLSIYTHVAEEFPGKYDVLKISFAELYTDITGKKFEAGAFIDQSYNDDDLSSSDEEEIVFGSNKKPKPKEIKLNKENKDILFKITAQVEHFIQEKFNKDLINDVKYVGTTKRFEKRASEHARDLTTKKPSNRKVISHHTDLNEKEMRMSYVIDRIPKNLGKFWECAIASFLEIFGKPSGSSTIADKMSWNLYHEYVGSTQRAQTLEKLRAPADDVPAIVLIKRQRDSSALNPQNTDPKKQKKD